MFLSIFSDELGMDITKGLPIIKSWGLEWVDLRGRVLGKAAEALDPAQLPELKKLLDDNGMKVGCLQSSLCKVHLPNAERQKAEAEKLEGIIRAADALDCRLVRSFHFWQPKDDLAGELAVRPDEQQKVLDMFGPIAERAKEAGLTFGFENCGVTPDEVFTVLDALDVPTWGLAWDVANTWNCDERKKDEDAYILRMLKRTGMLHIKAKGAVEGVGDELIPYDKVLDMYANAGIEGPVSVETHNPDKSVSNEEMSHRVVQAMQKAWPTAAPGSQKAETKSAEGVTRPWQDDPVRYVVVGLGMGHGRSKMITETPGTMLVGVCDLDEERCKKTSEAFNVPYKTDLNEWLKDDEVEVIFILTETGNHAAIALPALEAGKHVLTTKPMEASLEACDKMIDLAEKKGLILGVDFGRRFETPVNTLKAAVSSGRLGKLLSGNCSLKILRKMDYFKSNNGWRGTRKLDGGGVLSNQAIHHIDEVAFTVGVPSKIRANIWTQIHEIEAEDLGSAEWLYDDGAVITFFATTNYPHSTWYVHYELHGTEGAYFQAHGGPFDDPEYRWYMDGTWSNKAPEVVESKWLNAVDNFAAALREGAELTCSGRDGRRSQAILDAMYRSAYDNNGGWVDIA